MVAVPRCALYQSAQWSSRELHCLEQRPQGWLLVTPESNFSATAVGQSVDDELHDVDSFALRRQAAGRHGIGTSVDQCGPRRGLWAFTGFWEETRGTCACLSSHAHPAHSTHHIQANYCPATVQPLPSHRSAIAQPSASYRPATVQPSQLVILSKGVSVSRKLSLRS